MIVVHRERQKGKKMGGEGTHPWRRAWTTLWNRRVGTSTGGLQAARASPSPLSTLSGHRCLQNTGRLAHTLVRTWGRQARCRRLCSAEQDNLSPGNTALEPVRYVGEVVSPSMTHAPRERARYLQRAQTEQGGQCSEEVYHEYSRSARASVQSMHYALHWCRLPQENGNVEHEGDQTHSSTFSSCLRMTDALTVTELAEGDREGAPTGWVPHAEQGAAVRDGLSAAPRISAIWDAVHHASHALPLAASV
jgi:hypothetical protein